MPTTPLSYVRFASGVEEMQPDEDKLTNETVESMGRLNRYMFEKHRHAIRDAHAKSHGVLRGELHIYPNLPEHLAQGVFHEAKTYPVIIRLSSAPGAIGPDQQSTFKGMAIKLIGVEGRKFLAERAEEVTQDFLLVNYPTIPTGDIASFHRMQLMLEQLAHTPDGFQQAISTTARVANKALNAIGLDPAISPIGPGDPNHHLLGETYHIQGAIRYGDYVAKISAAPLSENVKALTGQVIDVQEDGTWRDLVVDFFSTQGAEYEVRAQLCTNLKAMPVEDASVEWPADQSPYQPIGKIVIPAQDAYSPARRVYADDSLSFTPFNCLPDHQPLGSINRARLKAYEASAIFRHRMNAQPRVEPRDISQLPD
ncbi:MAG: catalase family protein [Janthinobacterium lividum]